MYLTWISHKLSFNFGDMVGLEPTFPEHGPVLLPFELHTAYNQYFFRIESLVNTRPFIHQLHKSCLIINGQIDFKTSGFCSGLNQIKRFGCPRRSDHLVRLHTTQHSTSILWDYVINQVRSVPGSNGRPPQ